MSFTEGLLVKADPYLGEQMRTPFVRGMIDGTLEPERLQYWVRVDYPYLINFSRILAMAVLRAPDLEKMRTIQGYLNYILDEELTSHERFAAGAGITVRELETQRMGPTKYAYAQHEFASASRGDLAEILTAIAPCLVGWVILSSTSRLSPGRRTTLWRNGPMLMRQPLVRGSIHESRGSFARRQSLHRDRSREWHRESHGDATRRTRGERDCGRCCGVRG